MQHPNLLIQSLVGLIEVVQLLTSLQVLLGQVVKAVGGAQQIVGELEVEGALLGQQLVRTCAFSFQGLLGNGLLRFRAASVIDQALQCLTLLFGAVDAFLKQGALGAAQVLQQAVACQFLAPQLRLRCEQCQFCIELVTALRAQGLAVIAAGLERIIDDLAARLILTDLGLRALGARLCSDDQTVGFDDRLVPLGELVGTVSEQLLQLRQAGARVTFGDRYFRAGLESAQLALGFVDQARRLVQLLAQVTQALIGGLAVLQHAQGLLKRLLQCQLLGFRQLAVCQTVEALLHAFGFWGLLGKYLRGTETQGKHNGSKGKAQQKHGRLIY